MKKVWVIVGVSIAAFALLVAVLLWSLFAFLRKEQNKEFYVLGSDSIPSFTYVLGERRLSGFSFERTNGEEVQKYNYRSDNSIEDGKKYTQYLVESEGFERITAAQGKIYYQKQSEDSPMLLVVMVVADSTGVSVSIYKEEEPFYVYLPLSKYEPVAA